MTIRVPIGNRSRDLDLRDFGVVGDGTTDDSAALRAALAAATAGSTIYGTPGKTYLVGTTLTASSFAVPSGTTSMPYLLAIPNGVTVDLRGATLKMKAATDAVMVTTAGTTTNTTNTNVGLVNAVLDGNNVTLSNRCLIQIAGVTRLRLDLKMINVNHGGLQLYNCSQVSAPRLEADTVVGQPYAIGQPTTGQGVTDSWFGTISARNVTPDPTNTVNFPGNVFYGELQRCTIDTIIGRSCSAGVKIAVTCADVVIGKVNLDTIGDSVGNSGLKLQGDGTGGPFRIHVGQVSAKACTAHGLWMEQPTDCTVDSYIGEGNQTLGTGPDVWIGGIRDQVGAIRSTGAGGDGVLVRSYAADCQIDRAYVRNNGQIVGSSTKYALAIAGGSGVIQSFVAIDSQGTPTMVRGINVSSSTALVRVLDARISGQSGSAIVVTAGTSQARTIYAGPPTYGQVVATVLAVDALTSGQAYENFLRSSLWYPTVPCTGTGTNQIPNQALRLAPFDVPRSLTLSGLAVEVSTAGEASSTFRFGIYADDGTGYPGLLVLDAGTVAADTTGVKTLTISQALTPGRYWVGGVTQGAATTPATLRTPANAMVSIGSSTTPATTSSLMAYNQTGVSGALPSPFTTSVSGAGQAPRIYVQIA